MMNHNMTMINPPNWYEILPLLVQCSSSPVQIFICYRLGRCEQTDNQQYSPPSAATHTTLTASQPLRMKSGHESSESDEDERRQIVTEYPQIAHDLPIVSKEYEEQFLREPVGNERSCSAGRDCEGMCINGSPGFVLREFLLPAENQRFLLTGQLPRNPKLCLLCTRKDLQRNLTALKAKPPKIPGVIFTIQSYGNIIDRVGEYKHGICHPVQPEYGIVAPLVRYKRKLLRFMIDQQGLRRYRQVRVEYEDPRFRKQSADSVVSESSVQQSTAYYVQQPQQSTTVRHGVRGEQRHRTVKQQPASRVTDCAQQQQHAQKQHFGVAQIVYS